MNRGARRANMLGTKRLVKVVVLAGLAGACTGQIQSEEEATAGSGGGAPAANPGDPAQPGGSTNTPPSSLGPGTTPATPGAPAVPGAAPLRRLTVREYTNTVRDLLGVTPPGRALSVNGDAAGFAIGAPVSTATDASRLLESAEQLAQAAAGKISSLLPCPNPTDAAAEAACAKTFIQQFGRRAFRRPLDNDEVNELLAVYTGHRESAIGYAFPDAIRAVVTAMLASPFFLYRAELGPAKPQRDGAFVRFNSHEVASRLSYGLWATMPDDALFAEADAGKLATPEQIANQARRMLKDARFREALDDFHLQWLEIEGLPTEPAKDPHFKDHNPALVQAMMAETKAFIDDLFAGANATGSLEKFFTSTATTVDPALGKLYGVDGAGAGKTVNLDPKQRAGILTQASFLSMHADTAESHPVRRGAMMMRRVFCVDVPPPPNMDVGEPKPPTPGVTTRQRYDEHSKQECASCHRMTDPLGFAFEHYDAIGGYRTMDQGQPVDASGSIDLPSGKVTFKDAVELAQQLPQVKEVQHCLAAQWLRYLLRRNEFDGDKGSLDKAIEAFARPERDVREMLVGLVQSRAFTHRTPSPGEVLP
jgi:Protein of unknown function (DUF1592)/Protein of unknown function (DUF1588)/Protein of unknown function (DUF1595)/Protein of unknown function (DUF1585)/Protein of unknown function (DUF1587)